VGRGRGRGRGATSTKQSSHTKSSTDQPPLLDLLG
jgi:SCY1-like protein 2